MSLNESKTIRHSRIADNYGMVLIMYQINTVSIATLKLVIRATSTFFVSADKESLQ